MSKLNCDVINDLIPSYIDGICSTSSKALVDEHLVECRGCQNLIDMMKETEIVSKQADINEIDYMKRVKKHYVNKNIISLGLLIGFIVIGMAIIIGNSGIVPLNLYYVVLPALMLSAYFILSDNIPKKLHKREILLSGIGILAMGYCVALQLMCMNWIERGTYPFGLEAKELGPFIYTQLLVLGLYHIVIFIMTVMSSAKADKSYSILLSVSAVGTSLALAFISIIKNLSSIVTYVSVRNNTLLIIILEGIVVSGVIYILDRKLAIGTKQR